MIHWLKLRQNMQSKCGEPLKKAESVKIKQPTRRNFQTQPGNKKQRKSRTIQTPERIVKEEPSLVKQLICVCACVHMGMCVLRASI